MRHPDAADRLKSAGMGQRRWNAYWWLLAGGIVLLSWLGVLQYRWIRRASDAELQERRQFLRNALSGVRGSLVDRLRKPLATLHPDRTLNRDTDYASYFASRFEQWQKEGGDPGLIGSMTIGWIRQDRKLVCFRMGAGDKSFAPVEWPPTLSFYRADLERRSRFPGNAPPFIPEGNAWSWNGARLWLVFPLVEAPPPDNGPPGMVKAPPMPQAMPPPPRPEIRGWCFLEVEPGFLQRVLPELVLRYFGEAGAENYRVALVEDLARLPVWQSYPLGSEAQPIGPADDEVPLFLPSGPGRPSGVPAEAGFERRPPPDGLRNRFLPEPPDLRLVAQHKAGSLDKVVLRSRNQSLAFSIGALLLLFASGVLLVLSTHRERRLARQQMEFVAGVSHELRTPLTVIQTTSYNLAQGKLSDWKRVREYGEAIQKEVRRLTTQVEQMLSFAGIESGRKLQDLKPADVADAIERALAEYAPALEAEGWHVERTVDARLPAAVADSQGLRIALKNLIENAVKYASIGRWLGISVRAAETRGGREIQITVSDRGPGIGPDDLPHIFDPFYRGHNPVAASETPGVGLGLCLVRRHVQAMGGSVTVATTAGRGATFTLHLRT